MKPYTSFEINKLITVIENYKELEFLSEIVLDNHESYNDKELLMLTKRIADKSIELKVKKNN
jgi:hypothetical protein